MQAISGKKTALQRNLFFSAAAEANIVFSIIHTKIIDAARRYFREMGVLLSVLRAYLSVLRPALFPVAMPERCKDTDA